MYTLPGVKGSNVTCVSRRSAGGSVQHKVGSLATVHASIEWRLRDRKLGFDGQSTNASRLSRFSRLRSSIAFALTDWMATDGWC